MTAPPSRLVSQVVAYLERLADVADITLISFEKETSGYQEMGSRLERGRHHMDPLEIPSLAAPG